MESSIDEAWETADAVSIIDSEGGFRWESTLRALESSLSVDERTTRLGGEDERRRDKSRASTLRTSMDQQTSEDETRQDYQLSLKPFPTLISMV